MKLDQLITQYINYRRSLGAKFDTGSKYLKAFCKSIESSTNIESISECTTNKFLYGNSQVIKPGWFMRHSALLGLYQYALARNYITTSPLPRILPKRQTNFVPYIYSKAELKLLFGAALTYQKRKAQNCMSPHTVQAILILTYTLGLRIQETLSIALKDVDLDNASIVIRDSKFYKSRLVPFNIQIKEVVERHLQWRIEQRQSQSELSPLFMGKNDQSFKRHAIEKIFRKILKLTGIKRDGDSHHQPRIHDLRHSFAVHRLTSWYREKKNVQQLLPLLSTFLGHQHLAYTAVYLTMTDELLREASELFEKYAMEEQ